MTLTSILAWPLTLAALAFMYPWARWLLAREADVLLLVLTTLALSVGGMSLAMLAVGLAVDGFGGRIDWRLAALLCAVVSAAGVYVLRRDPPSAAVVGGRALLPDLWREVALGVAVITGVLIGLIVFNAVYWPFGADDALAIYGWFGKSIALSGQLPRGTLYETYPMLLPLSFAFSHQAAGWIDEHLAALIPALLSVGVVGVAWLLGTELYNRAVGLSAALLTAAAVPFSYWASASYADLPTALFYGLAGLFLVRHYRTKAWQDALLAGVMAGLAAWTKNSGLLIISSVLLWIAYTAWRARFDLLRPVSRRDAALIAAGFLGVCGPWYIRTLLTARLLVPPTGWTWAAQRTVFNLFPYVLDARYGWVGWLYTGGLLLTLWWAWRSRAELLAPTFLLIMYLPFFGIWWLLFSYEGRFLLALTPFAAVMAGALAQLALMRIGPPPLIRRPALIGAALAFIAFVCLPAAVDAVAFKPELLRRPFMSDADKHRVRLGGRYDIGQYVQTLPPGVRVLTPDTLLAYSAYPVRVTISAAAAALTPDALIGYQYLVLMPGDALPAWFRGGVPLFAAGGERLYSIQPEQFR